MLVSGFLFVVTAMGCGGTHQSVGHAVSSYPARNDLAQPASRPPSRVHYTKVPGQDRPPSGGPAANARRAGDGQDRSASKPFRRGAEHHSGDPKPTCVGAAPPRYGKGCAHTRAVSQNTTSSATNRSKVCARRDEHSFGASCSSKDPAPTSEARKAPVNEGTCDRGARAAFGGPC